MSELPRLQTAGQGQLAMLLWALISFLVAAAGKLRQIHGAGGRRYGPPQPDVLLTYAVLWSGSFERCRAGRSDLLEGEGPLPVPSRFRPAPATHVDALRPPTVLPEPPTRAAWDQTKLLDPLQGSMDRWKWQPLWMRGRSAGRAAWLLCTSHSFQCFLHRLYACPTSQPASLQGLGNPTGCLLLHDTAMPTPS